jgi:hypothetical protein
MSIALQLLVSTRFCGSKYAHINYFASLLYIQLSGTGAIRHGSIREGLSYWRPLPSNGVHEDIADRKDLGSAVVILKLWLITKVL